MNFSRNLSALLGLVLLATCLGCGWATPASKKNTMTGVSESGYPKGQPADAESPALSSMEKPGKELSKDKELSKEKKLAEKK
jgi:hypothetical protein